MWTVLLAATLATAAGLGGGLPAPALPAAVAKPAFAAEAASVIDNQPPSLACPVDLVVLADWGGCFASAVDLGTPLAADNIGVVILTNDAPTRFPIGINEVVWTAVDGAGNTTTCVQRVVVVDDEAPEITPAADVVLFADPGRTYASNPNLSPPAAVDNCGGTVATNNLFELLGPPSRMVWVDPNLGDDATAERANKSRPYATMGRAVAAAQAGDTIVMLPGTNRVRAAFFLQGEVPEVSVINKTNLTIVGFGAASVILATNLGDVFYISNAPYLKLMELTVQSWRETNVSIMPVALWGGITVDFTEHLRIEGCRVYDHTEQGIACLNGMAQDSTNDIVVVNNHIRNCGSWCDDRFPAPRRYDGAGIVPSAGWRVENNLIEDCAYGIEPFPVQWSVIHETPCLVRSNVIFNCLSVGIGTSHANARNLVIENNLLFNVPGYNRGGSNELGDCAAIHLSGGAGHLIRGNLIVNRMYGIAAGSDGGSVDRVVIESNRVHGAAGFGIGMSTPSGIGLVSHGIIRDNVITDVGSFGIGLDGRDHLVQANLVCNVGTNGAWGRALWIANCAAGTSNIEVRANQILGTVEIGAMADPGCAGITLASNWIPAASFAAYVTNEAEVVLQDTAAEPDPAGTNRMELPEDLLQLLAGAGPLSAAGGISGSPPAGPEEAVAQALEWAVAWDEIPVRFPLGTNVITWTATDEHGNLATRPQRVIVLPRLPPPVAIRLDRASNNLVLFWPASAPACVLESASTCGPSGVWTAVTAAPVLVEGFLWVTLRSDGPERYFRLRLE